MAKSGRSKSGKSTQRKKGNKRVKRLDVGPAIYLGLMVVVMVGLALAVYLGN